MPIPYTVQAGDTLTAIAKAQLGDAKRFGEIRDEQQQTIKDPNKLKVNQILMLPDDADLPSDCVADPDGMAAFDAGYQPLYQAVVNAYSPSVTFLVDQLLNYCNESINATLVALRSTNIRVIIS